MSAIPAPADFAGQMIETRTNGRRGELETPPWMTVIYQQVAKLELDKKALETENDRLKLRIYELEHR